MKKKLHGVAFAPKRSKGTEDYFVLVCEKCGVGLGAFHDEQIANQEAENHRKRGHRA